MAALDIEALLIFNDIDRNAVEALKANLAPLEATIKSARPKLHLHFEFLNQAFEVAYPSIKRIIEAGKYHNTVFNLDQCGHTHVAIGTLNDILRSFRHAEIFYTFVIDALIAFLNKSNPSKLQSQLSPLGITSEQITSLQQGLMSRNEWLGAAERIVFEVFEGCAPYVSPFSINNPNGWRYWLIHFANSHRARQVYNNVLHDNSTIQAHFGRSGLDMLAYDPSHDAADLFLFDDKGRQRSKTQLLDDIPRLIEANGDAISVMGFYEAIYNYTPAHSDDVHSAVIEHPDLEIITSNGGERRKPNTIVTGDTIRLRRQRTFFPMFSQPVSKNK